MRLLYITSNLLFIYLLLEAILSFKLYGFNAFGFAKIIQLFY